MNELINIIQSSPIYSTLAVLVGMMLLWAVLKRLIKAAVVLFVCLALYGGYLTYTGKPMPKNSEDIIRGNSKQIETLKKYGRDLLGNVKGLAEEGPGSAAQDSTDDVSHTPHLNKR